MNAMSIDLPADEEEAFVLWIRVGQSLGWVSKIACLTHDGLPSTDDEHDLWEEGFDPCEHAVRVWGPE